MGQVSTGGIRKVLQMPISRRLQIVTLGMALLIAAMGGVLYLQSYRNSMAEVETTLRALAAEEAKQVPAWYATISSQLLLVAEEPFTVENIARLGAAIRSDGGLAEARQAYVEDNPHPRGEREALTDAGDGSAYSFAHKDVHARFSRIRGLLGFYDIFLFDLQGNVIYSVVKEADFGENMVSGPFADTGLGDVFRRAVALTGAEVVAADFKPYAPSAGEPAAFLATPVRDPAGRVSGVLAVQVSVEGLSATLVQSDLLGQKGDIFIVGDDGRARTRSRFEGRFVEYQTLPELPHIADLRAGQTGFYAVATGVSGAESIVQTQKVQLPFGDWTMVVEVDRTEHLAAVLAFRTRVLLFVLCGLAAGILLGLLAARSITRPLASALTSIEGVAAGDYGVAVPVAERHDEIGQLGRSVQAFRDKLAASAELEAKSLELEAKRQRDFEAQEAVTRKMTKALESLAAGDLTRSLDDRFPYGFEPMRNNFNVTLDTLSRMLRDVATEADEIQSRGELIARATDELARRTETQAATLEETAAALNELTGSVRSAAEGAAQVERVVTKTRDEAVASSKIVNEAVGAMAEIKKSSDDISRIIAVIDDIAFQTNLLALNAGVEAARAGDAGRGFAVVAAEVRALSIRSSEAAREIKDLISTSTTQVVSGVSLVNRAGDALTSILDSVSHVASLVSDIASGAREQAMGIAEINVGVGELDKVTQQNTQMVDEATHASSVLKDRATRLKTSVGRFKIRTASEAPQIAAA